MPKLFQGLELRQNIHLTQDLKQAIEILQYSTLELNNFLWQEMELNPFLTIDDNDFSKDDNYKENSELEEFDLFGNPVSMAVYEHDQYSLSSDRSFNNHDYEQNGKELKSLRTYISEQIPENITNNKHKIIAHYLIDLLDDNGYINLDIDNIKNILNIEGDEIFEVLKILQKFEPVGVFARDLKECLKLQLIEKKFFDHSFDLLLSNLNLLATKNYQKLRKITNLSENELKEKIKIIKSLDPKPGRIFNKEAIQDLIVDLILFKSGDVWLVEINSESLPRFLVNHDLYANLKKKKSNDEKKFFSTNYNRANFLIKSVEQRLLTLILVAEEIVKFQEDFFNKGINYLKPMKLEDIATSINLSISTVSRVTNQKFMATPYGIFELKYFFSNSVNDDSISNKSIMDTIKKLIKNENVERILSDESISKILEAQGIKISRRTVTKYRETMGIANSSIRKLEKAL